MQDTEQATSPDLDHARTSIRDTILNVLADREELHTCVDGLTVTKRLSPVRPTSYLYAPSFAMILQGRKNIVLGDASYHYDEAHYLLTAADLPTITEVVEASPDRPYVSLLLTIDFEVARELIVDIDQRGDRIISGSAMVVGPADLSLFQTAARLVALTTSETDAHYLTGGIKRELLYRLLTSPTGGRLREIVRRGSDSNALAETIAWLRRNYRRPLLVEELAERCAMGLTTFHLRFKAMTSMTPIQYQKHLRLHQARRQLINAGGDVGTAAMSVGYESVTQFNRDYKRMFGDSPRRDIQSLACRMSDRRSGG